MYGRFDNPIARDAYRGLFKANRLPKSNFPLRYNIVPTDQIPIVRIDPRDDEREVVMARWGLIPFWMKEKLHRFVLIIALILTFSAPNATLASWWLVRSSDGKCLVVDIEPTGKNQNVTKIGKGVYQSANEAEADAKRLLQRCKAAQPICTQT